MIPRAINNAFRISSVSLFRVSFAFLLSVIFALMPSRASAAKFSLELSRARVPSGSEIISEVRVDTEGEFLNGFEGEALFPRNLLEVVDIRDGSSIVTVWLERPKAESKDRIAFSGITPGGYQGDRGLLFQILFRAKEEGSGFFALQNARAFLNDGNATPAPLSVVAPHFTVTSGAPSFAPWQVPDRTAPERFKPQIAENPDAFGGKRALIFVAEDKESGVAYYEVCEGLFAPCTRGESPYVLRRQSADSLIKIRAVDQSGNVRVARVSTVRAIMRYSLNGFLAILGVTVLFYAVVRWRRHSPNRETRK